MKRFLTKALFGLALVVAPAAAQAACTQSGTLVRVLASSDGFGPTHTLYLKRFSTDGFYFSATSTDDMIAEIATTAVANGTRVQVSGDAASCPTSGKDRNMGAVRFIAVNP